MPLSSTRLIPELQHYLYNTINLSILNRTSILSTPDISEIYLNDNKSFIRLLFDSEWPPLYLNYRYLYRLVNSSEYPFEVRTRMMIYPSSSQYYVCDSDSTSICNFNIFTLQLDDFKLLDKLLEYRLDSTSVIIIDIDYSTLTTSLSKLIYIYLDLKLNQNISLYNSSILISHPGELLANCYEMFIIEQVFLFISERSIEELP